MKKVEFTSSGFDADRAFRAYRDLYSGGSDVSRLGEDFGAEITALRFPRMLVFDRTLKGVAHERSPVRVERDGYDHVMIQLVVAGQMWVDTNDDPRLLRKGEIAFFDLTRPQRTWTESARIITVSVSRDVMRRELTTAANSHGRILSRAEAAFLKDYVIALNEHGPSMGSDLRIAASSSFGLLLGASLPGERRLDAEKDADKLDRAIRVIEARMSNPRFSIEDLAAATNVSRSSLYRLFESHGGVANCIQKRRLNAVKRMLGDPGDTRAVSAILDAAGFLNTSTGSRAFSAAFGMAPGAFRAAISAGRKDDSATSSSEAKSAFQDLFVEVR